MPTKLFAFLFLFLFGTSIYSQYNLKTFFYNAKQDISKKNYSEAIEKLNICISHNPADFEASYYRGICRYYLGDFMGAEQDLSYVLANAPGLSDETHHYLAFVRYNLGDIDNAIKDINIIINSQSKNPQLYLERAYFKIEKHDYAGTVNDCNKAISLHISDENVYICKGVAEKELNMTDSALCNFERAMVLNPYNEEVYIRRGATYASMEKYDEAIDDFNRAVKINPGSLYAYFNLAEINFKQNRPDEAINNYNTILKYEPVNAVVYFNKGIVEASKQDYESSMQSFNKVLMLNPENIQAFFNRGRIKQIKNDFSGALTDYNQALHLFPYYADAYYYRGLVKVQLKDYDGAKKDNILCNIFRNKTYATDSAGRARDSIALAKFLKLDANFHAVDKKAQDSNTQGLFPVFRVVLNEYEPVENKNYFSLPATGCMVNEISGLTNNPQNGTNILDSLLIYSDSSLTMVLQLKKAIRETDLQLFNDAHDDYNRIIQENSDCALAYFARGTNFCLDAEEYSFYTGENNTGTSISYDDIANEATEKFKKALSDFNYVITVYPDFSYAYFNRAFVKYRLNDIEGAINDFSHAVIKNQTLREAYYNRGLLWLQINKKVNACKDFSKAGELGIQDSYSIIRKFCQQVSE